jgi:integrase
MRWDELNEEKGLWTLPAERSKNGEALILPLAGVAWDIIAEVPRTGEFLFGRNGFANWSVCKAKLDSRCGIDAWNIHDLRRSFATALNELGVEPHIVEAILNHATFTKGTAGIYNRAKYQGPMAAALAMWASHIQEILGGEERKIIPLRG